MYNDLPLLTISIDEAHATGYYLSRRLQDGWLLGRGPCPRRQWCVCFLIARTHYLLPFSGGPVLHLVQYSTRTPIVPAAG